MLPWLWFWSRLGLFLCMCRSSRWLSHLVHTLVDPAADSLLPQQCRCLQESLSWWLMPTLFLTNMVVSWSHLKVNGTITEDIFQLKNKAPLNCKPTIIYQRHTKIQNLQLFVQPFAYLALWPLCSLCCFPPKEFVDEPQSGFIPRGNKEPIPFCGLLFLAARCCQPSRVEGLL